MAKTRTAEVQESKELVNAMVEKPAAAVEIEDMPLNSLADYMRYNRKARELNKKLKIARYPIKQCPTELHPHERVVFTRNDQPNNPLPVYLSNEMIHFDRTKPGDQLRPGQAYDLPRCVIQHLANKGTPIWSIVNNPDGSKDSRRTGFTPRFSLRTQYAD